MRWVCRMALLGTLAALTACGSTEEEDRLVLAFLGFSGDGINQADIVNPSHAEVDVPFPSCCAIDDDGFCTDVELFTQTSAIAFFQNNQKLDIRIDRYEVSIIGSSLGSFEGFPGEQIVTGRRCDTDSARSCAVDADCNLQGAPGTCRASVTPISLLLFDFSTKQLILPDVLPFGRTLPVDVHIVGSDLAGETYRFTVPYQARFDNFDNCEVTG